MSHYESQRATLTCGDAAAAAAALAAASSPSAFAAQQTSTS